MSKRIVVTGGTGLIGGAFVKKLVERGDEVVVLTRHPGRARLPEGARAEGWDPLVAGPWQRVVDGAYAVVHLAGDPVLGGRWTSAKKRSIRESRITSARLLVDACRDAEARPEVFVGASAVGFYGAHPPHEALSEDAPAGTDFLARVVADWEAATSQASALGIRTVRLRIGIVLGVEGGMLKEMLVPFRLHVGGPLGNGTQMISWIHQDDVVALLLLALDNPAVEGVLNAVAPSPVDMNAFAATLAETLGTHSRMRVPAVALRLLFGEAAEPMLTGQRAVPAAALALGYTFRHPELEGALRSLLGPGR